MATITSLHQVICPTCERPRLVSYTQMWQITSPKGRCSGECKSCISGKRRYPYKPKGPRSYKEHPLARSLYGTRFYGVWGTMKSRCNNRRSPDYKNYGGRGVEVCARWDDFSKFVDDMYSSYRPNLTIERIDVDGPYSPGNCRWATRVEQANNTRRNRFLEYAGVRLTISQWARETGIASSTLRQRFYVLKWPVALCLKEYNHA